MIPFAHQALTRVRAELVEDRYHNQAVDWANADRTTFTAHVQPVSSTENIDGRDQVTVDLKAWVTTADWKATDRVEFEDDTYEIVGRPQVWPSPGGTTHHTELALRLVSG